MIITDHVGISHVNVSSHNVRVFPHEVVICTVREALLARDVRCALAFLWRASKSEVLCV